MKSFTCATVAAALVAGVTAHGHNHQHANLHKKNAGSPVQKREPSVATVYVAGATETVYESNGKILEADEAKEGLKEGDFVVVGESLPTYIPPPPPKPSPKPKPKTTSVDLGAQFIESKTTKSKKPKTTSEAPPPPPPTTSSSVEPKPSPKPEVEKPKPSPKPKAAPKPSGGQGLDTPFPDDEIDCSEFPSAYGAVPIDYLGFGNGWSGLQSISDFSLGALSFASKIVTGESGSKCSPGTMCSYACPAGYQKTQWPKAQGPKGESVGGLFCGSNGKLRLTRNQDSNPTLCEKGVPGVKLVNKLSSVVAACRTDYPGTENMVLSTVAEPGSSTDICNPSQDTYYKWGGDATSAQYYLNPKGVGPSKGCNWTKEGSGLGNWAPACLGLSQAADGNTYIGLFQNEPMNSDGKLDYSIKIEGDLDGADCGYDAKSKTFLGSSGKGCTATMRKGGSVTITFY